MAEAAGNFGIFAPAGRLGRAWWLFRAACVASYKDNVFGIAKGAAYSSLLSFFPVLTTVTAILVQANANAVSRSLSALVFRVVPPGTEEIVRWNFTERGSRPVSLLIVAGMLSVWAASGVMMSLMEGFRAAYKIPNTRSFMRQRGIAALLVFAAAFPAILASALIVFGTRTEQWVLGQIGLLTEGQRLAGGLAMLSQFLRSAVAIAAIIAGTCLLYYIGPNQKQALRRVLPGALLATTLWWCTTMGFAWYVQNIANYNFLYGSVGAVIALTVWMYLLAIIALIGCEYNAQRSRLLDDA